MALNLPEARNTTYAPNTPVRSEDLTDFQDQIINLAKNWRKLSLDGIGDVVNFGTEGISFAAGAATRAIDFGALRPRDRIKTIRINYSRDAGDSLSAQLRRKLQGAASAGVSPAAPVALAAGTEVEHEIDVTADFAGGLEAKQRERYILYFVKTGASTNTGLEMLEYEFDTKRAP